jgi:hypothetical protein
MLKDMKSSKHLKPGQAGTKRLVEKYGDALLCVRYRDDEQRGVRLKTVELIVGEKPLPSGRRYQDNDMVALAVHYSEKIFRDIVKAAGGRWDQEQKLWRIKYGAIRDNAELLGRIIPE